VINKEDLELLQSLIYDNPELEQLEDIVDEFNIFTALKIVNAEIRHSYFLSWLMDPLESHGLGDYFTAAFLKRVAFDTSSVTPKAPSLFDIDGWSFDDVEVLREWRNIDILIRSDRLKFICVIENKVDSGEHSNQLARYKDIVEHEYPEYSKLFVYLTVEGEPSSEEAYISLSYSDIVRLIEHLIESKRDKLGPEVLTFIAHYNEMLRRYIVEDSEIQKLCEKIYKKHKRALDLIFEYRPDKLSDIQKVLADIIENESDLILDNQTKTMIRFTSNNLDFIPRKAKGWTPSKRILLFEFKNNVNGVNLYLIIGRGDNDVRIKLYDIAQQDLELLKLAKYPLYPQWHTIYKKGMLSKKEYEEKEIEEIRELLQDRIAKFTSVELPKIEDVFVKYRHILG